MKFGFVSFIFILMVFAGCSASVPSTPDSIPSNSDYISSNGILGAYDVHVDLNTMSGVVTPKRTSAVGESYIVSGMAFFTILPCYDCFELTAMSFNSANLVLTFTIRHPFQPGDDGSPPSATNRKDLDVFDLAAVVLPTNIVTATEYTLTAVTTYPGYVANASGYTKELANVIVNQAVLPYVLAIDDSAIDPIVDDHYNKFPMGGETDFDIEFSLTPGTDGLDFDLYLTMGYGASAKKAQRLTPTYYNPEFNRKAAWKIDVSVSDNWVSNQPVATRDVTVKIYDWQQGATVNAALTNPTDVYAASKAVGVSVEIPGMNAALQIPVVTPTGSGKPSDPLVVVLSIANENLLAPGTYLGLVKVTDERIPAATVPAARDFLIHTPNGIDLPYYVIPEYVTYQLFDAVVVSP
jgi:hypothetical protein